MIIDFTILEDKNYTFFYERELLRLQIKKKGEEYEYTLDVDKKANTELNMEIIKERKDEFHIIILIILIILAVFLTLYLRLWN